MRSRTDFRWRFLYRMSRVVFVGNLPGDIRTREVEDLFYKFGRIIEVSHMPTRLSRV